MKTRDTQGSFIILIWALIAKVEQLTNVPGVSTYPRAELVADLLTAPPGLQKHAEAAGRRSPPQPKSFPLQRFPPIHSLLCFLLFIEAAGVTHAPAPKRRANVPQMESAMASSTIAKRPTN